MSKASATKLDPEAQEAAAPPPPGSRRRRFAGAAAVAALVLLSLGELLLPLPDVGADDARVEIGFDGKDVLVDVDARPLAGRAWLHEVRVTRATCDVRAQAAGGALERVATVAAEAAGAGWPVRVRTEARARLVARVRDVDFDVARRLASSKLLYGSVKCDVVAETQLYGGLFPTTVHSNVGTAWEPTRLASKQQLFKKGSPPKRVWHDLRALAALVKDSLELSVGADGALAARWTESRAAVRLPAGVEAVTLRLPRVAYDLTGRAGGAGTLAFEGAELRFASDVPTLLDLPFRATGAFAVVGGEALDAMSTRVVALNATAVDADAFFGALLGPQHAVALRWSPELFTRDESAACYAARYEDLRDAFCTEDRCDTRALRRHYKHYGAAEKRIWGCRTPARRLAGAPEGAPPRRLDETGCVPDHCMTMTWDGDYTFTGCVGFDVDGKWLCAALERTRVSTGVVYDVAASAEGECCDGDVATSVFRLSATDEGGEVKLDGALVGEIAWSGAESDLSASLTASDQGVDKFSVAVAADGEASDDDAYEGGLTGAVQLTVATDDDQLLTAVTDDDQFEATLGGDVTWKKPKESTVQGCTCEGEEWTYSPWEDDYQGSTDGYRATTEEDFLDLCSMDEWEGTWYCLYGYESYVWDYGWYRFPRWCATDSSSCGFCDGTIADGKCWDWTEDQDEPGIDEISATTSMSLRVGDEDVVDDMTLGAEAKWGEAQDDDFAMSASFGFDEISATLATVVDVREDDNEGDVAMSFTVTDGGAELFFVTLALTGATDQPSARTASGGGGLSGSATLTTRVDGEQVFETMLSSAIRTDHDFYVELCVEDDAAERLFVDGKLDYDEPGDEDKTLWAQLVARVDGENSVDGELDAAAKWGDASAHNFEGDATVTRAAQRLGGATEELLYVAGAWDHDDETDAGSVALDLRDRGEAFDGTVSYDWTDDHYGLGIDASYEDTSSEARAYTLEASAAVDETHVADDVELKVVVTEDTGAETFYAAMTANGEADDGVGSGSAALEVRVTSDGVQEFSLATTIEGSADLSEGNEGRLTGAMELHIAVEGDDAFAAELGGDAAWTPPEESTVQGCTCTGEEWVYSPVKEEDEDEEDYTLRAGRCYKQDDMSYIYSSDDSSWVSSFSAQTCYDACVGMDETMGVVLRRYGGQGSDGSCGCSYQSGKTLFPGGGESGIRAQARGATVPATTSGIGRVSDPPARR